ncbi:M20 family metallopeptidase [Roseomonas sp. OT10]|uniref:M20 aminoacylase family protein n=1 Tax=Roseomonas cutis TaxID=2897332 RepID=UPI001E46A26D|nr:M20 aminoacylase family protein [Roseomonas sp. OT10]UFN46933.1 M20 family metallopeptidase [Roseomonas sp. OT10]
MQDVVTRIREYHPELTAIRRDIHAHPELGLEERRTAALVAAKLREWGVEVADGVGVTGVVGTVRGTRPGQRAIGLRADMDALAIHEETGLPHASTTPGVMHACGHDGHTTMLLGAARYLAENRDFAGTVHLIFQPAEEGRGGAKAMIADGLFDRFPCDAVYGLHNSPGMPVGRFGTRHGAMMAAADSWYVTFRGTGGHGGSTPHLATDATVVLGHFLLALQTIVPRNVAASEMAVVSVGHVAGGSPISPNVMPAEIAVAGTARSYAPAVRDLLERRLGELAAAMAAAQGCTAEFRYHRGVPAVINADEQVGVELAAAASLVGEAQVDPDVRPSTGGEDFSEMMNRVPGAFMRIGNGVGPDGRFHGLHTPLYDFNDEILPLGAAYWVSLVRQELGLGQQG